MTAYNYPGLLWSNMIILTHCYIRKLPTMDATLNSITYLIVQGINLRNDGQYSLPAGWSLALPHLAQLA
jgi:hypothetical protein